MNAKDGVSKHCPKCGESKNISDFNRSSQRLDGLRVYCRSCEHAANKARYYSSPKAKEMSKINARKYRATEKAKEVILKYKKSEAAKISWRKYAHNAYKNEELRKRMLARSKVWQAISNGKLSKKPCEVCGTEEKVHAHHDDYDQPLNVRFLCHFHHIEFHRAAA